MSTFDNYIKANKNFYKNSKKGYKKEVLVFLASKDIHMTALTMRFSKAVEEVTNSRLFVVPNISCSSKVLKMIFSFRPKKVIKKKFFMLKTFFLNIFFVLNIVFKLRNGEDINNIKVHNIEIGKHLYDYLLAKFFLSSITKIDLKMRMMIVVDLIYYLSSIRLISEFEHPLIILPDNAYRHGMIFEYVKEKELDCLAGLSMTEFTIHKYDDKNSYKYHCRTPSKSFINKLEKSIDHVDKSIQSYLRRISGDGDQHDVIRAFSSRKSNISKEKLIETMGLDPKKPIVMVAAHIFRDAPHAYPNTIFRDYEIWLSETCIELSKNTKINFVIKEHPSSDLYSEEGVIENILNKINCVDKLLPKNLKTSSLFNAIDCLITCGGTAGMEFALNGVPVLLAASPPYSGFGFTIDSNDRKEYIKNISSIHHLKSLNQNQMHTASILLYVTTEIMQANNLSDVIGSQKVYLGTELDLTNFYKEMIDDCKLGFGFNSLKQDISEIIFSDSRNIKTILSQNI